MSENPYLVSLVVPTKNRYIYLKELIKLVKSYELDELEFVVQDNSDDNSEFLGFLKEVNFPNLKYYYNDKHLSVSENTDLAISNATGEFVCFIGDDDGVLSNIVDCVNYMKRNDIEALRPAITIYNWPDYINLKKKDLSSSILYEDLSDKVEYLNPIHELKGMARNGFTHIYTMPKIYQAIIRVY